MDLLTLAMLAGGLIVLVVGGELLVRGASAVAAAIGISPLVIGLTVVAFGTSSPELAVSVQAGLSGNGDIAVGNVVGSNIFNVLFILGACAIILPLVVSRQLVRREVPVMIGVSLLLALLAMDLRLGFVDGALLFVGIVVYTAWSIVQSRRETAQAREGAEPVSRSGPGATLRNLALIVVGLALLVLGARWLVDAATSLARALGVSDVVIGLTIVAAGTSLPEVVTSIIATLRRERDIAIGNVVGSNIFNILGILGISALVTPGGLTVAPSIENFDIPVMIAVAVACLPIFFTGMSIARWEGGLFLGYYLAYTTYLILAATQHDALPAFSGAMAMFVLPLTAVTLLVLGAQALRGRRPEGATGPAQ
ncbi:MAG: calcium/sodium antiporter [Chloroflexi bacterium OHK40]